MADWNRLFKRKRFHFETTDKLVEDFYKKHDSKNLKKILDFGCGRGRHSIYSSKLDKEVFAVDISENALEALNKNIVKNKIRNVSIIKSNIDDLPFKDNFFDVILSINVVAHGTIKEIKKYFDESFRVLKKGGYYILKVPPMKFFNQVKKKETVMIEEGTYVYCDTPDGDIVHHFFTHDELREIFSNFNIILIKTIKEKNNVWLKKDIYQTVLIAKKK